MINISKNKVLDFPFNFLLKIPASPDLAQTYIMYTVDSIEVLCSFISRHTGGDQGGLASAVV